MKTLALAIPWCPWIPERVESMKRLRTQLGLAPPPGTQQPLREALAQAAEQGPLEVREFTDKASNDVWSEQVWGWLAEVDAEWCLQLQEDALVPRTFWRILRPMLEAAGDAGAEIVGLQVPHKAAPSIARLGDPFFTTADMLIGVGYAIKRESLRAFLKWRAEELNPGWREPAPPKNLPHLTEDTLLGMWAMVTGRRIWHPLPTIVQHDTSMASVWGNDGDANRRSLVTWHDSIGPLESHEYWRQGPRPPRHMGRFYEATPLLAARWVKGFDGEAFTRVRTDNGVLEERRLAHAERSRPGFQPLATAIVCTARRAMPHPEHQATVLHLVHDEALELLEPVDVMGQRSMADNIVLARSRHARVVVESGAEVGIFLDDDVSCDRGMLRRMVACVARGGRDIVCAPYPRRDRIDLAGVAASDPLGRPPESRAYRYDMKLLADAPAFRDVGELGAYLLEHGGADGCAEVESMPIGCSVIHRRVFEAMYKAFREELEIDDDLDGIRAPLVALFMLKLERRRVVGEDIVFLERARSLGFKVHAYFGPGSPATHHGSHAFRGHVGAFGLIRDEKPPAT